MAITAAKARLAQTFFDDDEASCCSEGSGPAAADHVQVPTFQKTKGYNGHRIGRIFKLGVAGLGYYADNGYTVELNLAKTLFQIGEARPVPLRLDKLVSCGHKPDLGKSNGMVFTKPRANRRRTRQRVKQAKCHEASLHQDHELILQGAQGRRALRP